MLGHNSGSVYKVRAEGLVRSRSILLQIADGLLFCTLSQSQAYAIMGIDILYCLGPRLNMEIGFDRA